MHKLAERKRRRELKETFDTLQLVLAPHRASKGVHMPMSKWQVLTEASEYMALLQSKELALMAQKDHLLKEIESLQPETR